jgi:predicted Zn-dependent protease
LTTPRVYQDVLGEDLDAFDRTFTDWFERKFATQLASLGAHGEGNAAPRSPAAVLALARQNPGDFWAQLLAGQVLVRDGRVTDAVPLLERAKLLFPEYAEADGPYRLLARVARDRGASARRSGALA